MTTPFLFPAQPAGPPSRRNWYQELLDHPECKNDPVKIQEAYASQRSLFFSNNIRLFEETCAGGGTDDTKPVIQVDAKLRQLLEAQRPVQSPRRNESGLGPGMIEDVGCLVIWARLPPDLLSLIQSIQQEMKALTGDDLYIVPASDLHLSVLELSHRHNVPHLQAVADRIGNSLLHSMLDEPAQVYQTSGCCARLMTPQLSIDKAGIAITFVPELKGQLPPETHTKPNDGPNLDQSKFGEVYGTSEHFTYHHLRNNLHKLALSSGIEIDACYTAATAHVAIGRFIGTGYLLPSDGKDRGSDEKHGIVLQRLVDGIKAINARLQEQHEAASLPDWKIGWESGLELQLGLVKYGRASDAAMMVGGRARDMAADGGDEDS